jgi:hypothetical protein
MAAGASENSEACAGHEEATTGSFCQGDRLLLRAAVGHAGPGRGGFPHADVGG